MKQRVNINSGVDPQKCIAMIKAYKYKLKPTVKQKQKLFSYFGCVRKIYNWGLDKKILYYKEAQKTISYKELSSRLKMFRSTTEWLNECPFECLQQSLRCLENAYKNFFKNKKGFPKFKSKHKSEDTLKFINGVKFDFNEWKVKIPKVGWVKLCKNKQFDLSSSKLGTLTVKRDKCGDYWCMICVTTNEQQKEKAQINEQTSVGIDLGLKSYITLSDGTKCEYGQLLNDTETDENKFLDKEQKRLNQLLRKFSKTQKHSHRHEILRLKIAKLYRHIQNKRVDYFCKLASQLTKQYDTICIEDLNVSGMLKNHKLARSIQNVSWSEFVNKLSNKCDVEGKNILQCGRFDATTQTCNVCGHKEKFDLKVRHWVCPDCKTEHDRDINAAINIMRLAIEKAKNAA